MQTTLDVDSCNTYRLNKRRLLLQWCRDSRLLLLLLMQQEMFLLDAGKVHQREVCGR